MALKKSGVAAKVDRELAEGFLNLKIKAADGSVYALPKGLPLDSNNRVLRSILNKAKANPEMEFELVGSVWLQPTDGDTDIVL